MDFEIYSSKSRNKAVPRRDHEDGIRELTDGVKSLGAEKAIRHFMASWTPPLIESCSEVRGCPRNLITR